ncbi:hypothetical protein BJ741DRAFT_595084 [Chytriomyces cf. hyalinus JEL632]|nr:hypothetical protein BJ741DRAFT_595084 [Chytriomyces cf. hyalinus JEL632]
MHSRFSSKKTTNFESFEMAIAKKENGIQQKRTQRMPSVRQVQDLFKALLAFVLAFSFIFSTWNSWVQPRSLPSVILVTIVLTPGGKTVGNFLDSSVLLLACIAFSSVIWAFTQAVAGESYTAMASILFIIVYFFSTLRAINPARFFVPALITPLLTFTAITSVVGVTGPNTTNNQLFDSNFLVSTIKAYLIGIAICLSVNVLVFPDFASRHLNAHFVSTVKKISSLLNSTLGAMSGSENTEELRDAGIAQRNAYVISIHASLAIIETTIRQASAEVSYSHYSIKDYTQLLKRCKGVVAILCSINTSIKSETSQKLMASTEFLEQITPSMKDSWMSLGTCCESIFEEIQTKFENAGSKKKTTTNLDAEAALVETVLNTARNATEALQAFERHRPNEFLDIFSDLHDYKGLTAEQIESWDKLTHVTFHILAAKELVNSLNQLHSDVYRSTGNKLQIRLHFAHYLPGFIFVLFAPKLVNPRVTVFRPTIGARLTALKNVFLSSPSIFGLKLSTAMLCFLMVLYTQPVIFQQWSMSGAFVSILVAISPSLGQTYLSLPIQIVATTLGSSIAYGGVCAFGRDGAYGLTGFAALLGVPFYFLMLSNIQFLVLGLLTLLSFSNFVVLSFINRANPRAVSPDVSLYRGVAVTSIALSFSLIFTLVLYPTLARNALRQRLFEIFGDFRNYHGKIVTSALRAPENMSLEDSDIKDTRDNILSQLASLEPLMTFAAIEPRLAGKFQSAKYRAVILHMRTFLDRLEALRVSSGDAPFDSSVRKFLNFGLLGEARTEMQQTVRILMHIFASSMLTKQKLPSLPDASKVRNKLFQAFITIIMNHAHHVYPVETDPLADMPYDKEGVLATLNTEKWLRLLSFSASARDGVFKIFLKTPCSLISCQTK